MYLLYADRLGEESSDKGSQRLCFPFAHCAAGDTLLDQVRPSHRLSADAERADVSGGILRQARPEKSNR
jgi:hypothetical protein